MLKILAVAAALLAPSAVLAQTASAPEPIQVMIVGTFHFDNPGHDINNVAVDPVTTPSKQAELAAVAEGLRRFHPTAVAVERIATDAATLLDQHYPAFTPADLLADADERVQIGYRLADLEGLTRVYAIDEQPDDGERDYFPFDNVMTWATAHHQEAELAAINAPVAAYVADLQSVKGLTPWAPCWRTPTVLIIRSMAAWPCTTGCCSSGTRSNNRAQS